MSKETSLLDFSQEEFIKSMRGTNLGNHKSTLVFIKVSYEQLNTIRKDTMRAIKRGTLSKEDVEVLDLLKQVFQKMQDIEEKALFLIEEIKRIEAIPLERLT